MIKDYLKLIQYKEQQKIIKEIKNKIVVYENVGILNRGNIYKFFNENIFSKIKDKKIRHKIQSDLSEKMFYSMVKNKETGFDLFNYIRHNFSSRETIYNIANDLGFASINQEKNLENICIHFRDNFNPPKEIDFDIQYVEDFELIFLLLKKIEYSIDNNELYLFDKYNEIMKELSKENQNFSLLRNNKRDILKLNDLYFSVVNDFDCDFINPETYETEIKDSIEIVNKTEFKELRDKYLKKSIVEYKINDSNKRRLAITYIRSIIENEYSFQECKDYQSVESLISLNEKHKIDFFKKDYKNNFNILFQTHSNNLNAFIQDPFSMVIPDSSYIELTYLDIFDSINPDDEYYFIKTTEYRFKSHHLLNDDDQVYVLFNSSGEYAKENGSQKLFSFNEIIQFESKEYSDFRIKYLKEKNFSNKYNEIEAPF